jgi:glyoxylase-like metal-dependent hydrolase (beta-lactamase superfamily II)
MRTDYALVILLSAAFVAPLLAQESGITFKSTELAPGLYMLEGEGGFAGGNLGLMTGEDGVVLIDDGLPPLTDKLLAAIGKLSDDPVEFVVNTHVHGDHIGANEVLTQKGATIVAHDNLRRRLVTDGMRTVAGDVPAPEDALPVVTFSDAVTFHLNGREAYVFHVDKAHTDGDAVIHFRDDNVIHAGDAVFNGLFPFIDLDSGGSVSGFIAAQHRILAMADDETKIIPGHGPLADKDDLQAAVAMLEDAYDRVRLLVEAGKSKEEILAANPLAKYHDDWNWGFITTEVMTETLVRALTEN